MDQSKSLGIINKKFAACAVSGVGFDFKSLAEEFTKICPDYGVVLTEDAVQRSLGFTSEVLFRIGPDTRLVKKDGKDRCYGLRFINNDTGLEAFVEISTYKATKSKPPVAPKVQDSKLSLSAEQASLLALAKLSEMSEITVNRGLPPILTPLAGAVFCKTSIARIYEDLELKDSNAKEKAAVINRINESVQIGGHYLPYSSCAVAMVCVICGTKYITFDRERIINKVMHQYTNEGKKFDPVEFNLYSYYGTDGVPPECTPEKILKLCSLAQDVKRETTAADKKVDYDERKKFDPVAFNVFSKYGTPPADILIKQYKSVQDTEKRQMTAAEIVNIVKSLSLD